VARKHHAPSAAPASPDELKRRIERARTEGRYQQALELTKQLCDRESTLAHRELLREAYLGRARQLRKEGKTRDAATVVGNLVKLVEGEAAWLERAASEYAACGEVKNALDLLDRVPSSTERPRVLAAAVDAALSQGRAGRAILPESLQAGFDQIVQAFAQLEAGQDDAARETLQAIGLQSPFLEWKLLLRGLQAYYLNDDERTLENWSRLNPERAPVRLAAALRYRIDPAYRTTQPPETQAILQRQADRLGGAGPTDSLRLLQAALASKNLPRAFQLAEQIVPLLRRDAPQVVPRLAACFYWEVLEHGYQEDTTRHRRLFGAPADDPDLHRMEALALERCDDLSEAHRHWQRYEKWVASKPGLWPGEQANRARALIWCRMGANAASIPDAKRLKKLPSFLRDHPDRPKPLKPTAAECFQRALELAPDQLATHEALIEFHENNDKPDLVGKAARALLERFPEHGPTLERLADLCILTKSYGEALEFAQRALKANPLQVQLRKKVSLAHQLLAREFTEAGRFDEARQAYQAALAGADAQHASGLYCKWAACEFKAKNAARAEELLREASSAPRLVVAYQMLVESSRLKLPPAIKKRFDTEFKSVLAETPEEAAIAPALEVAAGLQSFEIAYHGQKTHEKKLLASLDRIPMSGFTEAGLLSICRSLLMVGTQRLMQKYASLGQRLFSRSPHFPFVQVQSMLAKGVDKCPPWRVMYLLDEAEKLANKSPPSDDIKGLLTSIEDVKKGFAAQDMLAGGLPAMMGMMGMMGFDEDDEDDWDD